MAIFFGGITSHDYDDCEVKCFSDMMEMPWHRRAIDTNVVLSLTSIENFWLFLKQYYCLVQMPSHLYSQEMKYFTIYQLFWCIKLVEVNLEYVWWHSGDALSLCKAEFIPQCKAFFIVFSHAHFRFWGQECLSDRSILKRYPKSDAAPWVEKIQLQERFTLMTHDFVGHLKTLYMSVLSLNGGFESEWKRYSSPLSVEKKTLLAWIQLYWRVLQPSSYWSTGILSIHIAFVFSYIFFASSFFITSCAYWILCLKICKL